MKRLLLFDIDGTLMRGTGPHHGDALVEAIHRVIGLDTTMDGIPVHGMLDPDILRVMMTQAGCDAARSLAAMPEIISIAEEVYPARCPDLRAKVLPGVRDMLAETSDRGIPMGLVTGNLTRIGWTKLERAGLKQFFTFGAFAEMAPTRTALARLAFELSGAHGETEVTLIGDAPSDVEAAQANSFRMVAVATGMTPLEELIQLGADIVLTDLSRPEDRKRVLE